MNRRVDLDASSALLVMKSLKSLVENQGVTVCSVIHQPRKFIYDLFDSLILLGVGGRMVYHGPADQAEAYFNTLNYALPQGESVADWLIDISSGRLEPTNKVNERKNILKAAVKTLGLHGSTKQKEEGQEFDDDEEEGEEAEDPGERFHSVGLQPLGVRGGRW